MISQYLGDIIKLNNNDEAVWLGTYYSFSGFNSSRILFVINGESCNSAGKVLPIEYQPYQEPF